MPFLGNLFFHIEVIRKYLQRGFIHAFAVGLDKPRSLIKHVNKKGFLEAFITSQFASFLRKLLVKMNNYLNYLISFYINKKNSDLF